jgi:hypothetical protein
VLHLLSEISVLKLDSERLMGFTSYYEVSAIEFGFQGNRETGIERQREYMVVCYKVTCSPLD